MPPGGIRTHNPSRLQTHDLDCAATGTSSFTYIGTELTREKEDKIEIQNIIMSANKVLLYNCDLHAENINSEYTRIYIAIKLNIQAFNWTSSKLRLQSMVYDLVIRSQEKG
jgi:hypothetical protein